jgi:hypothetical protein
MKISKTLGFCALVLVACHHDQEATSNETRSKPPIASNAQPSPILANTLPVPSVASACELGGRIDLQSAKRNPAFAAAREKIMGSTLSGTGGLSSAVVAELEQTARSVSFCEARSAAGRARVIVFEGDYPSDILERIAKSAPNARLESSAAGTLLNVGNKWLGRAPQGLALADQRATLERGLSGELLEPLPTTASMLEFHFSGAAAQKTVHGLAQAASVDPTSIVDVALSMGANGQSSELRLRTRSTEAASALLSSTRAVFAEVQQKPALAQQVGADLITVEADDRSVAIRCRAPLEQFMRTIGALQAKKSSHHD